MSISPDLLTRLSSAVERGVVARNRYFDAIGLPDEQSIGPPAHENQVAALELQQRRSLPPSYRAFLLKFGRWQMIDGGVDLLPVADLLGGPIHDHVVQWQEKAASMGDEVAGRGLVIGTSRVTATKYILNPASINSDGEWTLVQHHHGVEAELPSFLDWLEQSVDEYQELAHDPN